MGNHAVVTDSSTPCAALSQADIDLLERSLHGDYRELRQVLDRSLSQASADDLNDLREVVAMVLISEGLDRHYKPNELSSAYEGLMVRLAPWNWGKNFS
jgi:hypothetical protein